MEQQQAFNEAPRYQTWRDHLIENQIKINGIQELYAYRAHKDGSIRYTRLKVDANTPEGTKLNPIYFSRATRFPGWSS